MSIPTYCEYPDYLEALPSTSDEDSLDPRNKLGHCRFCARKLKCGELLDLAIDKETMDLFLIILEFFKIDFIDFSDTEIPKTTCELCYNKMNKCYSFFVIVKESQTVLKQLYCIKDEKCDVGILKTNTETVQNYCEDEDLITDSILTNIEETVSIKGRQSPVVSNCFHQSQNESKSSLQDLENNDRYNNPANTNNITPECDVFSDSRNLIDGIIEFEDDYDAIHDNVRNSSDIGPQFDENSNTISVLQSDCSNLSSIIINDENDYSWISYPWSCLHCQVKCTSLDDLRWHSMQLHKKCYALQCVDCCYKHILFNKFYPFIEHVRQHRENLRYYCPYCNERFESISNCSIHTLKHLSGGQQICDRCGQIFPNADALKVHKILWLHKRRPAQILSILEKNTGHAWNDYEWACQECSQRFSNVEFLRTHTQQLHNKCFSMKCADCHRVSRNYRFFVKHVISHRPYMKSYCPYCNEHIEDEKGLQKHVDDHFTGPQKPCDGCGQIFQNKHIEAEHYNKFEPERCHKYLTMEDLTCKVCQNVFSTIGVLKKHKRIHDENRKREHICNSCGKQFLCKRSLDWHMAIHNGKETTTCKVCNKSVWTKKLRLHVIGHLKDFICDYCKKRFPMKHNLKDHILKRHLRRPVKKKHKCEFCGKLFNTSTTLASHRRIHTGERPFKCENCERTFSLWTNCNRHMKTIHNTTLVKKKSAVLCDEKLMNADIKEWIDDVRKDKRNPSNKKFK